MSLLSKLASDKCSCPLTLLQVLQLAHMQVCSSNAPLNASQRATAPLKEQATGLLRNVHCVVFYSTPHFGADLARLGRRAFGNSPALRILLPFNKEAAKLHYAWMNFVLGS